MIRTISIAFILFSSTFAISQPGGGGGIAIYNIYDKTNNQIDIENNLDYDVSCFLLSDTVLSTVNIYSKMDIQFKNRYIDSIAYVPAWKDSTQLIRRVFSVHYKIKAIRIEPIRTITANYRLLLTSINDTMVIDFVAILGDNPHGKTSIIDSLHFLPGYFQYKKENANWISSPSDTLWTITKLEINNYNTLITTKFRSIKRFENKAAKATQQRDTELKRENRKEERIRRKSQEYKDERTNYKLRVKKSTKAKKEKNRHIKKGKKSFIKRQKRGRRFLKKMQKVRIRGMDRHLIIQVILYHDKSIPNEELKRKTDEELILIAKEIDKRRK